MSCRRCHATLVPRLEAIVRFCCSELSASCIKDRVTRTETENPFDRTVGVFIPMVHCIKLPSQTDDRAFIILHKILPSDNSKTASHNIF